MEQQDKLSLQVVLPSDEKAEINILGTMICHEELFTQVEDIIDSTMFYNRTLQFLFRIFKYIIQKHEVIDESSVVECFEKFRKNINITVDEIKDSLRLVGASDSPKTFMQDVNRVIEYSTRRKTWEILQKMSTQAVTLTENADDTIRDTIKKLEVVSGSVNVDSGIIDAKTAIDMVYAQISDNLQGVNRATFKTGFRFSDAKGGLRLGSVVVVGAWTSVGKTSLAMNIAYNVASSGVPSAYYSLEMGAVELWSRIIACNTNISAGKILNYPLKREEVSVIDKTVDSLYNIPLYIDDKATTSFSKMLRSVRTMVKKYGIKLFVVDYLQIFAQNQRSSNEESIISGMARECKNICRELNICCILLSQLRRDKDERHPTIDMLRGSGQIEESADVVVLIDRPDAHPDWGVKTFLGGKEDAEGKAELRVCKGRNIGLGTYIVGFDATKTQFYELDGYKIGDEIAYDDGKTSTQSGATDDFTPIEQDVPF